MPERAAILAHLRRSRDGKAARRPDSNTQRRIAAGQLRLLDALIREIETGAHLEIRMPEQTHTAMPRELETCPTCSGKGRLPAGSRCLDCDETGLAPYGQALRALDETRRDRDGWRDDAKRLMAERDDLRARLAVALEGCCPDCGGSGIGADACDGPGHHTPPCPSCEGSGLAPGARQMATQRNVAWAERDAALARVTELEAPGECASIHKLRAQVADLQAAVERARPVVEALASACDREGRDSSGERIDMWDVMIGLGRGQMALHRDAAWLRSLLPTAPGSVPVLAPAQPAPAPDGRFTVNSAWRFK